MPSEATLADAALMDLVAECDPARLEAVREILAHLVDMPLGGLAAMRQMAPHFHEASQRLDTARIQGRPLQPHDDFPVTSTVLNATNSLLTESASAMGISNLAQDNNLRVMEICQLLRLAVVKGRNGNDLVDGCGQQFELKTCSLEGTSPSFTTNHHLKPGIVAKYRSAGFIFAVYSKGSLVSVWVVHPNVLDAYFAKWEQALATRDHLNNPTISVNFVNSVGELVYGEPLPQDWHKIYGAADREVVAVEAATAGLSSLGPAMARSLLNKVRDTIAEVNKMRWSRDAKRVRERKAAQKTAEKAARAAAKEARRIQKMLASEIKKRVLPA